MTRDEEPETDADLVRRLRVLYEASDHSGGARDDFWDCVSHHIGCWIVDLAERGALGRAETAKRRKGGQKGGLARAAALNARAAQRDRKGRSQSALAFLRPRKLP